MPQVATSPGPESYPLHAGSTNSKPLDTVGSSGSNIVPRASRRTASPGSVPRDRALGGGSRCDSNPPPVVSIWSLKASRSSMPGLKGGPNWENGCHAEVTRDVRDASRTRHVLGFEELDIT